MAGSVKIEGWNELVRDLDNFGEDALQIMKPYTKRGASRIVDRARIILAGGKSGKSAKNKSGALSDALKVNEPKRSKKYKYVIFSSVWFEESGRHGVPVELGHKFSGFLKDVQGRVPEHPFLRPAADQHRQEYYSDAANGINDCVTTLLGGKRKPTKEVIK